MQNTLAPAQERRENFSFLRSNRSAAAGYCAESYISRITGIISGLRLVDFWIYRLRSVRIFSLITP